MQRCTRIPAGTHFSPSSCCTAWKSAATWCETVLGCLVARPNLDWEKLPPRVEAVIAERLGRLPQQTQHLLEAASVEGEEFTAQALARVLGGDDADVLRQLSGPLSRQHRVVQAHGFVRLEPEGREVASYRFQHILFQKYLYQRLDKLDRRRLHGALGEALETLYGPRAADIAIRLAWHFEQAGAAVKSASYLMEAGEQAMRLYANEEAAAHFKRALLLLQREPESVDRARLELRLRLALARPLAAAGDLVGPERVEAIARACQLSPPVGSPQQFAQALFLEADLCRWRGELDHALALSEQLAGLAQASGDRQTRLLAEFALGASHVYRGEQIQARPHLEEVLGLYRADDDRSLADLVQADLRAVALGWLADALWIMGFPDQAALRADHALTLALEVPQAFTLALVLTLPGLSRLEWGQEEAARSRVKALRQVASEYHLVLLRAWISFYDGWLIARQGHTSARPEAVEAGIALMHAGLAAWRDTGTTGGLPHGLTLLTRTCLDTGHVAEGECAIDEALGLVDQGVGRSFEAEMWRLKGELLWRREQKEPEDEAANRSLALVPLSTEACFLRSIEVARRQQARAWELRSEMSLYRWWTLQDQASGATVYKREQAAGAVGGHLWLVHGRLRHAGPASSPLLACQR